MNIAWVPGTRGTRIFLQGNEMLNNGWDAEPGLWTRLELGFETERGRCEKIENTGIWKKTKRFAWTKKTMLCWLVVRTTKKRNTERWIWPNLYEQKKTIECWGKMGKIKRQKRKPNFLLPECWNCGWVNKQGGTIAGLDLFGWGCLKGCVVGFLLETKRCPMGWNENRFERGKNTTNDWLTDGRISILGAARNGKKTKPIKQTKTGILLKHGMRTIFCKKKQQKKTRGVKKRKNDETERKQTTEPKKNGKKTKKRKKHKTILREQKKKRKRLPDEQTIVLWPLLKKTKQNGIYTICCRWNGQTIVGLGQNRGKKKRWVPNGFCVEDGFGGLGKKKNKRIGFGTGEKNDGFGCENGKG